MKDDTAFSISIAPVGKYTVSSRSYVSYEAIRPVFYQWRWSIASGCYFMVERAPNRFHRFMQRVFLGLIWERIP